MIRMAKLAQHICNSYELPFEIFETLRDIDRQTQLVNDGKSKTIHSKHLTGEAFDMVLRNPDWSWIYKGNEKLWYSLGYLLPFYAKKYYGYNIRWGGDWGWDFPHFEWLDMKKR